MTHQTPDLTPPSPRRTDDAFARAVRGDVDAARTAQKPWRLLLAAPLAAAMAFGIVAITSGDEQGPPTPTTPDRVAVITTTTVTEVDGTEDEDSVDVADVADVVDDSDDDTLLALAGDRVGSDLRPAFAFADLDGSTEQDLAAVEAALDRALTRL